MNLKLLIKQIISFIYNPYYMLKLSKTGGVIIGKRTTIKNINYLRIGKGVTISDNSRWIMVDNFKGRHYDCSVTIGNGVFVGHNFTLLSVAPININNHVLIASNVMITSENHGMNPELCKSYASLPLEGKPVEIGEGCWLGEKVIVLPGVTLGERCVVAAGAVVTKSFPSYTLLAGVPAKAIKKYSFSTHTWEKVSNE